MPNVEDYDIIVLGSGAGGKLLAWTLGAEGKRVAVVERKYIGGACPNIACLPSKNLVHSAKVASYFHRRKEFGIAAPEQTIRHGRGARAKAQDGERARGYSPSQLQ